MVPTGSRSKTEWNPPVEWLLSKKEVELPRGTVLDLRLDRESTVSVPTTSIRCEKKWLACLKMMTDA